MDQFEKPLEFYKSKFKSGPIGIWSTYCGGGLDGLTGLTYNFQKNGNCKIEGYSQLDDESENNDKEFSSFKWCVVSPFKIKITWPNNESHKISYDIIIGKNEYDIEQLQIVELEDPILFFDTFISLDYEPTVETGLFKKIKQKFFKS